MNEAATLVVPSAYGVGAPDEDSSEVPLVRVERFVRREIQKSPPTLVVGDAAVTPGGNPFGGARRLMTNAEAPEMFGLVRDMSSHYQRLDEERSRLDEHIQLLIERRMRVDTNLGLMRQSLNAYAKVLDIEDILPQSIADA